MPMDLVGETKGVMTGLVNGDLGVTEAVPSHVWILNYAYSSYRCI